MKSDYFVSTYRFTQSQDTVKRPKICSSCKYKFDCSPCPNLLYQHKTGVPECEWANHKLILLKKGITLSRFAISKTLLYAVKDSIIEIFDPNLGNYITLNETASLAFRCFSQRHNFIDVLNMMKAHFPYIPKSQIKSDLVELVIKLKSLGYLENCK